MDLTKLLDEVYGNKNECNMANANIGSPGTNVTYDKAQGKSWEADESYLASYSAATINPVRR
jgi:hypothetical protein